MPGLVVNAVDMPGDVICLVTGCGKVQPSMTTRWYRKIEIEKVFGAEIRQLGCICLSGRVIELCLVNRAKEYTKT